MSLATLPSRNFYLLLAVGVFLLDQASKWTVAHLLVVGETRRVLPGLFSLTHVRNRGAAFGLFSGYDSPWVSAFLVAFSVVALALVWSLLGRGPRRWAGLGLGLILGGALGNLLDRLRSGSVVDFLDFHLGAYHWPAFNLADSAIVLGAGALVVEILYSRRAPPHEA